MRQGHGVVGAAGVFLALALAPSPAHAQDAGDKAAAEALFDEGKRLMVSGKYADACPKFAESLRLDVGIGTSLWLAECFEKNGQTASAWAQFREAAAIAVKAGDARERTARERARLLEPRLSKMRIVVAPPGAGVQLQRDGEEVGAALGATDVPVDPGRHVLRATAPGKKPWETTVQVLAGPGTLTVPVPPLEDAPPPPVPPTPPGPEEPLPPPASGSDGQGQRTIGMVAAGVGAGGVVLGSIFGLIAMSELSASNSDGHCRSGNHCDAIGVSDRSSAQGSATVSTVAFAVGGAALAGGVVLYLTAPKRTASTRVGIFPLLGPGTGGLFLRGGW